MFYSFESIVCLILEDTLMKNGLYFIEVYKQGTDYYLKDKLFFEATQLSSDHSIMRFQIDKLSVQSENSSRGLSRQQLRYVSFRFYSIFHCKNLELL